MQPLCTFSPVFFFFLRTIWPNHPLTGNLVCSCHMVCLSICWLPSSLSSLVHPQAYYPISHVGSLTFFPLLPCYCSYNCPLCLHFLLSPAPSALLHPPCLLIFVSPPGLLSATLRDPCCMWRSRRALTDRVPTLPPTPLLPSRQPHLLPSINLAQTRTGTE